MRALALVLLLSVSAGAQTPAALLISEVGIDGVVHFWWDCAERPELPVTDQLAIEAERAGLRPITRCDGLAAPIHKSLRKAPLAAWEASNLAAAVNAKRVVVGEARFVKKDVNRALALVHVQGVIELKVVDVASGDVVTTHSDKADGFDIDAELAAERARDILLSRALEEVWRWAPRRKPAAKQVLGSVTISGAARALELDAAVDAVAKAPGVTAARIVGFRRGSVTLAIEPAEAEAAARKVVERLGLRVGETP